MWSLDLVVGHVAIEDSFTKALSNLLAIISSLSLMLCHDIPSPSVCSSVREEVSIQLLNASIFAIDTLALTPTLSFLFHTSLNSPSTTHGSMLLVLRFTIPSQSSSLFLGVDALYTMVTQIFSPPLFLALQWINCILDNITSTTHNLESQQT